MYLLDLNNASLNSILNEGGVAIFTKWKIYTNEGIDLKIQTQEFEAVWIEIDSKGTKNTITGTVYVSNLNEFYDCVKMFNYT